MKMFAIKLISLCVLTVTIVNAVPDEVQCLGCPIPLNLEEAKKDLTASLQKVAAGGGPVFKVGKINSATIQVVGATAVEIDVDLIDADDKTKHCKVSIWSRPWLPDGTEVTFDCDGEAKIVRKYSA